MLASDYRNPANPWDVNQDLNITALDALQVINEIGRRDSPQLGARPDESTERFWDVTGDEMITALDALRVINFLGRNEGDPVPKIQEGRFDREFSFPITVGEESGVRTYRVDINMAFDDSDDVALVNEVFNVYIVDPLDFSQTLVDGGTNGAPVFSFIDGSIRTIPGISKFDGSTLEIDLSGITKTDTAEILFQFLNTDADSGGVVTVHPISNSVDSQLEQLPTLDTGAEVFDPGNEIDLNSFGRVSGATLHFAGIQYDSTSGLISTSLQVENGVEPIGRSVALVLDDLESDVRLINSSGTTDDNKPYINLRPSIQRGGLAPESRTGQVRLTFENRSGSPFSFTPIIYSGGVNGSPIIEPIGDITAMVGEFVSVPIAASDPDGDRLDLKIASESGLPSGVLTTNSELVIHPAPGQEGIYHFHIEAEDGALTARQHVALNVVSDPLTTTRISGVIENTDQQPLSGVPITVGTLATTTAIDGSFEIEIEGNLPDDTLVVHGQEIEGNYPYIAEKLPLVLNHDVYINARNVIPRPIYLPQIDVANSVSIDPSQDTVVSSAAIPGASLFVASGTLSDSQGLYSGDLSITMVPPDLTPAALPSNLRPDLVFTIQPGDMQFDVPAPLTFPNSAGYESGSLLDLWSINPDTGDFDDVGDMQVSPDGELIETISGGVRSSSWHFPAPLPPPPVAGDNDNGNEKNDCNDCKATVGNFEVELHSGAVVEEHSLVTYQSVGTTQGLVLHYDSLRADPRPIVHLGYENLRADEALRLAASLVFRRGEFSIQVPGHAGNEFGIKPGEHFWKLPETANGRIALQADLTTQPTGTYSYEFTSGVLEFDGKRLVGSTTTQSHDLRIVNTIDSPFGAGWGVAGLKEIVQDPDGSVLLVDGEGSELYFRTPEQNGEPFISPPGDFSTLTKLVDGSFRQVMPEQTVYEFGANGALTTKTDRNGNIWQFAYNADDIIAEIKDPAGLTTSFTTIDGRIRSITDPAGRVTALEYDEFGNLARIVDPDPELFTKQ